MIWPDYDSVVSCFEGLGYRVVESQEEVATTKLVDSLAEQALLEEMLDENKPQYFPGTEHLHYLLRTPFRYAPLKYGSRFGSRYENSIFYGSLEANTALIEVAYYKFLFNEHLSVPYDGVVSDRKTLFSFRYRGSGVDLRLSAFNQNTDGITSVVSYTHSQACGRWLRDKGASLWLFSSARAEEGVNIALNDPSCFVDNRPQTEEAVYMRWTKDTIEFKRKNQFRVIKVDRTDFFRGSHFPVIDSD